MNWEDATRSVLEELYEKSAKWISRVGEIGLPQKKYHRSRNGDEETQK